MALLIRKRFTAACMKPCTYRDGQKFAFLFEVRKPDGLREYRLAEADKLLGPWANVPDWTVTASHGELLRSGIDEHPEADLQHPRFLVQELTSDRQGEDYAEVALASRSSAKRRGSCPSQFGCCDHQAPL